MRFLRARHFFVNASFGFYLLFSLIHLELPGLEYDEVLFANAAMGNVDGTFVEWEFRIGGLHLPIMLMPYIGALKAYLYAPIFALFGASAASVRLPVILVGLITLTFTYKLVGAMIGREIALLSLVLLATDPTFIFANKLDWGPIAFMMALKTSSLYLLWRWLNGGKPYYLGLASLILGLGLFDKIVFVWFLAALGVALPSCFWRQLRARLSWRGLALGLACFLVGCAPLIAFNVVNPWRTFDRQKVVTTSWSEDLAYRYQLFRHTLNGSAVQRMVNDQDSGFFTEILRQKAEGKADKYFSWLFRRIPVEETFHAYALLVALGSIVLLWLFGRLSAKESVLFFLLLLVFISAFLCATAQATGPHHVIMIYPFTHVLIAVAVRDLARLVGDFLVKGRVGLVRIAVVACIAVLVFPQLVVAAGYLKSFSVTGGTGEWSDAIYQFADYAERQGDITFLLMDWGFSNQLLVLSNGRIKKEEAFVSVIDLPSEDEKIAGMYPHLTRANSLLVFHTPRFETFPLLGVFKRALAKYGFVARVVKTFYQRDGQPIYLVYQISQPEIDSHVQAGHFFYLREAEEWDAHFGGGIDVKPTASQGKALGKHWGQDTSHFVAYRFDSPKKVADAHLYIRYAFERPGPQRYHVLFDDNYVDILELDGTGGFGYTAGEWRVCHLKLGPIEPGTHELKIKPVTPFQAINLDYIYLSKGELWLESGLPPRANGQVVSAASGGNHPEIPSRAAVRLELSPAQATAGKSYLTLRVLNFDVPSIDILYSIDGKTMPPIYGWQLDENHTATVFVGLDTRRGLYRYEAIRDSRAAVPMDWIRVDAKVLVK